MNYHLKPIDFRNYALILICALFMMVVAALSMEIYFETIESDLTRVGYFSERDFGWQAPQLAIPGALIGDYPFNEADVLVIGDSFSNFRIWQSQLIRNGLKVHTLHWADLNNGFLPKNLGQGLRSAGFKGRYVVIETVERALFPRANILSPEQYQFAQKYPVTLNTPLPNIGKYDLISRNKFSFKNLNGLDWNIKTLINRIKLFWKLPKTLISGTTVLVDLEQQGCKVFTSHLCQYGLFFAEDFIKETFNFMDNIVYLDKGLKEQNIQPIWVVIPDKSTIYLGYGKLNIHPYQNPWHLFAQYPDIIAPNLAEAFIKKSQEVKDLYLPSNTHFGSIGYLYLGDIILNEIHKAQSK